MIESRFSLTSGLIGSGIGLLVSGAAHLVQYVKAQNLNKNKLERTDSLNQEIGYLRCKLDSLKNSKKMNDTKNIFKRNSTSSKNKEIDLEIKEVEQKIKIIEQQIAEIRSCNTMRMFKYVENKM